MLVPGSHVRFGCLFDSKKTQNNAVTSQSSIIVNEFVQDTGQNREYDGSQDFPALFGFFIRQI